MGSDSTVVDKAIVDGGASPMIEPFRLVHAMERIADALERIAGQQTLASVETGNPATGFQLLRSDVASTDQHGQAPSLGASADVSVDKIAKMETQLADIQGLLKRQEKLTRASARKFYAVDEVAELTGFKPWTIRQACNKGRIKASKGDDGRWRILNDEVVRLQEEGLPAELQEEGLPAE